MATRRMRSRVFSAAWTAGRPLSPRRLFVALPSRLESGLVGRLAAPGSSDVEAAIGAVLVSQIVIAANLLFDPRPAVGGEPLLRQKPAFVIHLARAADPIAEVDVAQSHALRACDVIEHHQSAERPRRL